MPASQVLLQYIGFQIPQDNTVQGYWDPSRIAQRDSQKFDLPLHSWVTDGAAPAPLGTPSGDDLGLVGGTFGSDGHAIQSVDEKANGGAHACRAVNTFMLPVAYVTGQTIQVEVRAGMDTTPADASATVDLEAYLLDDDGDPTGSDLVTTAAQSINSLTLATKTFTIDQTSLEPGDKLMLRLSTTVNDAATETDVIAQVKRTTMLLDVKV